jgi:hypothetical protein
LDELVLAMDDVILNNHYISTGTFAASPDLSWQGGKMEHDQSSWFIIVIFAVLGVIGALAAVAIPHTVEMAYAAKAEDRATELYTIQTAVAGMLSQSPVHQIQPIGRIVDMGLVQTTDTRPLVLADFLPDVKDGRLDSGYSYSFTADGLVLQYAE